MKKINCMLSLIINVFVFILLIIFFGNGDSFSGNINISVLLSSISLFLMIYILLSIIKCGYKWNNITFLFLILYYVFTFGQVLCKYTFNFIDMDLFDMSVAFNEVLIQKAMLIGIYSLVSMHTFAIIYKILEITPLKKDKTNDNVDFVILKKLGYILLFFSVPFAVYELYTNLGLAYNGGYEAVYTNVKYGVESIVSKISPFFQIALFLLIYTNKFRKKNAIKWLIIGLTFNVVSILLGNRGLPLLHLLSLIVFWNYIFPIPRKKVFLLTLSLIPLSGVISLFRVLRETAISSWINNFGTLFISAINDNPILKTINEMGTSIYPISASLNIYPNMLPYKYGITFLYAIGTIIPNLSTTAHWAKMGSSVNVEVASIYKAAFGGSIIQEFYANFSWFGCILFLGLFMFLLNIIEKKCINSSKSIVKILFFSFLPNILWVVRNNAAPLIKDFVWYILSTYIFYILIKYRTENKKNEKR